MIEIFMGCVFPFYPTKLVLGILISDLSLRTALESELASHFGEQDYCSQLMDFTFSHYYDKEMGTPLKKYFIAYKNLVDPQQMVTIKTITNAIEETFKNTERRPINLDPGHLFLSKFILTTTKDGSHRIPLHDGIYAEITLMFKKNSFHPLEWTYPDFRSPDYISILNEIRQQYKPRLKEEFDLSLYSS